MSPLDLESVMTALVAGSSPTVESVVRSVVVGCTSAGKVTEGFPTPGSLVTTNGSDPPFA